jgi:hypothetical protein
VDVTGKGNSTNVQSPVVRGMFKFKREPISKKFIHNKMEKFYTLFSVVPVDCNALGPTLW